MTKLEYFFENPDKFTKLKLSREAISAEDVVKIAEILESNETVTTLDLSYDTFENIGSIPIEDAGAEALGRMLEKNNTLKFLKLQSNQIGNAGAIALANGIEKNNSLYLLDIRHNQIESDGAIALAKARKINNSLGLLDLSYNQISDAGAEVIEAMLGSGCGLDVLDLSYNYISNGMIGSLIAAWTGSGEHLFCEEQRLDVLEELALEEIQNLEITAETSSELAGDVSDEECA